MKNITYINAGAGSGKTYKLTHILADLIKDGKVNPEEIIMTTFTTKAAAEIKEEAKAVLYKEGKFSEATRLDQALIGTVHSVCQQMIGKYWFRLGLSPNLDVLTDDDADFYTSQSLADLPTESELKFLHDYCENFDIRKSENFITKDFDYDFWKGNLKRIIELTTNYELKDYKKSVEESLGFLKSFVDKGADFSFTTDELKDIVDEHVLFLQNQRQSIKNDERLVRINDLARRVYAPTISWHNKLHNIIGELKKCGPLAQQYFNKTAGIWNTQLVYDFQERYVKLMFELAERWNEKYAQYKREKNLIDFNDMEKYMCKLLTINDVRNDISRSYKYLFVDEFQDSSPIQVKIFDALSELVEHSYWVGDYKQAIYGFRGSDTDLTKSVVDKISKGENGCATESLTTSYRSLPDIVNLDNAIFSKTFAKVLDVKNIKLDVDRENKEEIDSLRYFCSSKEVGVAAHIAKLVNEGVEPKDIAVLARSNAALSDVSSNLNDYGIKSCFGEANLCKTMTYSLVESLLRIVNSENDTLAKAQVAYLIENDCGVKEIIERKLEKGDEFFEDIPLIVNLKRIKPRLLQQSVSKMVESLIIELNLFNIIKGVEENPRFGASVLDSIICTSTVYEDHCIKMNLPATVDGFISYVANTEVQVSGDNEGVQLNTYHSSKGLQWNYVIMMSLNDNILDDKDFAKKNIFGVRPVYVKKPSAENQFPEIFIRFVPWIYGSGNTNVPEEILNIIRVMPCFEVAFSDFLEECNRLFYVGMTRPRDVLILDVKGKKPFACPQALGLTIGAESAGGWDIFNTGLKFLNCTVGEDEAESLKNTKPNDSADRLGLVSDKVKTDILSPRYISPSSVYEKVDVLSYKNFGKRVSLAGNVEMNVVGDCIHQIFAGIEEPRPAYKIELSETIGAYGLSAVIKSPDEVVESWNNLISYLKENHGDAVKTYHERPFCLERDGQTIVGSIDFVYQTNDGDILVDFKTCPLGQSAILNSESDFFAGKYGGQLNTYTEALEAAGEKVLKKYLYYPVSGLIVEI